MNQHSMQDLEDLLASAKRHAAAWESRDLTTEQGRSEAYDHLAHTFGALERLSAAANGVRSQYASQLVEHQTDRADALKGVWDEAVGDREYGFNPDGGAR
jgi:hypothetical protein